jgi:hypothetical protein
MNRRTAKLIRGFCKLTSQPYRQFKKAYMQMSDEQRRDTKIKLRAFWTENKIDHKKYYDLKKPLAPTQS